MKRIAAVVALLLSSLALAVSSNGGWGWAGNNDRGLARANAMAQCETQGPDCHVVADVCSVG